MTISSLKYYTKISKLYTKCTLLWWSLLCTHFTMKYNNIRYTILHQNIHIMYRKYNPLVIISVHCAHIFSNKIYNTLNNLNIQSLVDRSIHRLLHITAQTCVYILYQVQNPAMVISSWMHQPTEIHHHDHQLFHHQRNHNA